MALLQTKQIQLNYYNGSSYDILQPQVFNGQTQGGWYTGTGTGGESYPTIINLSYKMNYINYIIPGILIIYGQSNNGILLISLEWENGLVNYLLYNAKSRIAQLQFSFENNDQVFKIYTPSANCLLEADGTDISSLINTSSRKAQLQFNAAYNNYFWQCIYY